MVSVLAIITYFKLKENQNTGIYGGTTAMIITYFKLKENQNEKPDETVDFTIIRYFKVKMSYFKTVYSL